MGVRSSRTRKHSSQRGVSLLEAAMLIALIAVVAVPSLRKSGIGVGDTFCQSKAALDNPNNDTNAWNENFYLTPDGYECIQDQFCLPAGPGDFCDQYENNGF